ncbi:MAG: adenylosuccinate synthetase [Lachnobacterium sp.]|nr:adenylosuccinate synthetase [Lachnobacterium sp.]
MLHLDEKNIKAYSTCVGAGPFVAEKAENESWKNTLREAGGEYGAATGRPRRVGPFDVVASRYGAKCQNVDKIALTKLDVLSNFEVIPVITAYKKNGVETDVFDPLEDLDSYEPVVEYLPGWEHDISNCKSWEQLPENAKAYVNYIEKQMKYQIEFISTGAWRVRSSMNELSELMEVTCTADIGLMSINYTCFDGDNSFSQSLCLTSTGVNTSQLNRLEKFVIDFKSDHLNQSCEEIHSLLDDIEKIHGLYTPNTLAAAAALACGAFTFLLGGGVVEMLCAFVGAGIGNYIRCRLSQKHYTLFLCITASVSAACLTFTGLLKLLEIAFSVNLLLWQLVLLRLLMSFCGVLGFSLMFNSPIKLAMATGIIGAVSNTIRLEFIDLAAFPPAVAAFICAFIAGILASTLKGVAGYPRISITVPSIVIMVPGLYLYRGFYNLGIMELSTAASWLSSALLIILALPLGLIFARIITDKTFRYCT